MLFRIVVFAVAALAWGQTAAPPSEVFPLAHSESPQAAEELAITLRTVGRFQPSAVLVSQNSLSVSGTADQLALARWLIGELDQPTTAPLPANSAERQYLPQDGTGEVVCVLYLAHSENPRDFNEVMTAIRAVNDVRQMYPYFARKAIGMRGTPAQTQLAVWAAGELDTPATAPRTPHSTGHQYQVQDGSAEMVGLTYLAHSGTPGNLNQVMILIRTMTDIRRVFPVQSRSAMSWRGTVDQIRLVEWLVRELDQPADAPLPPNTVEHQNFVNDGSLDVVRLFHLAQARTPRDVNEAMTLIRSVTDMRRAFPYQGRKVLGFRGTAQQIQMAAWLVNALALPPGSGPQLMTAGNEQVGVFFLPPDQTSEELQALFGAVRRATQAGQSFFTEARKAIAIRGTADQIAIAKRMIEQP
ncbi:MAG TPA: hypothetical protein VGK29_28325 [Paludibaculum sp.]